MSKDIWHVLQSFLADTGVSEAALMLLLDRQPASRHVTADSVTLCYVMVLMPTVCTGMLRMLLHAHLPPLSDHTYQLMPSVMYLRPPHFILTCRHTCIASSCVLTALSTSKTL